MKNINKKLMIGLICAGTMAVPTVSTVDAGIFSMFNKGKSVQCVPCEGESCVDLVVCQDNKCFSCPSVKALTKTARKMVRKNCPKNGRCGGRKRNCSKGSSKGCKRNCR